MDLSGKVALVTGAGSGIGKGGALHLARHGAKVGVLDRSLERAEEIVALIRKEGGEALPLQADVSNPEHMQAAIDRLAQEWDRLDIIFANAGVNGVWAPLDEITPEEWDRTLNINLKGTFLTVKYALPYLKRQGGSIIITSSINGTRVFSSTGATAYSCSKGAQAIFAKMTALELAQFRIRVNTICPGAIETNIGQNTEYRNLDKVRIPVEFPNSWHPLEGGKPGTIDQVARVVVFLASDFSDHVTGAEIMVDGAESLLLG